MVQNDVLLAFSKRLNEIIEENEISGKELAHDLGVHDSVVCRWRKPDRDKFLPSILQLADYFQCTLDFLCGRTDDYIAVEPKSCPPFGRRLTFVLKERGKTTYQLFTQTSIKSSHYSRWLKGAVPKLTTIVIIAEFLDVSLDYLIGRED